MLNVAVCQIEISLGNLQINYEKVMDFLNMAADAGAELAVFPELSLCGYQFDSFQAVEDNSLAETSRIITSIDDHCRQLGLIAVVGFIEDYDGEYYNTACIFGVPGQFPRYRKVHLTAFGTDRFVSSGNLGFSVSDISAFRLGINICYDQRFPESARSLSLLGAQIIVVPTSETMAGEEMIDILIRARAYENRVFYVWANRVGSENGSIYTGSSRIVNPMGEVISLAPSDEEDLIFAEIDTSLADDKGIIIELGECEMHLMNDRTPEYYGVITEVTPNRY